MKLVKNTIFGILLSASFSSFSLDLRHGSVPIELGVLTSSQGKTQNINIQGFLGNQYTLHKHHSNSGLFGIGYFVDGVDRNLFKMLYGLNGFYLGKSKVGGTIVQEHFITNLAYNYDIANLPVYFSAKGIVKNSDTRYNIILDAGIGPNFMRTSHYHESPLNNYSATNAFFSKHNNVVFSAMAGAGLRINNFFGKVPLTCGYRFFYLGKGKMHENNSGLLNSLNTGSVYANAVTCGLVI